MALKDDLQKRVKEIFASSWTARDGNVVPDDGSITLGNDAVKLNATVLYADLSGSTSMVDTKDRAFSAEVYKSYLHVAAKIINTENGAITAYDGDRIMAVFIGGSKNSTAARCGLKLNWAVKNIINPAIVDQYGGNYYSVNHVVGIDTSELFIAKTGVRGANDLVWVGRAANYAAKLSGLNSFPTYITDSVYNSLEERSKFAKDVDMWQARTWTDMNNMRIYGSTYWWAL